MQLQFNIELNNDDELIHKAHGTDNGRVVINRFLLWIPKLTPNTACMINLSPHVEKKHNGLL